MTWAYYIGIIFYCLAYVASLDSKVGQYAWRLITTFAVALCMGRYLNLF